MFWWWAKRIFASGLIFVALGVATMAMISRPMPPHPFTANEEPLVIAHRGGCGLWPENTMFAFERAARMGVDVLEFDIRSTADSVLVVIHDATVDRTTDGAGAVAEMTVADLKRLDAGYRWTNDDGRTFPYRGQGITIPTLEEVLKTFPDIRLNIEIKPEEQAVVERFCRMIQTYGAADKTLVASFRPQTIERIRSIYPVVATAASTSDALWFWFLNTLWIGAAYQPSAHALQVPASINDMEVVTERFVEGAHRHNMAVHVWTINREEDMRRLIRMGVDGIMTDYPDRFLRVLGRYQDEG